VLQLGWLGDVVVASRQAVVARGAQAQHWGEGAREGGQCTLVLYSRFFLDEQAVLARKALPQVRPSPTFATAFSRLYCSMALKLAPRLVALAR
jgi:hypothetical protein